MAETNPRMEEAPRPQQTDARRRGPAHGVGKRLNTLARRVEYKIEVVGVWIDTASAQKTWDNLRAAVAQQTKLRAAQKQDSSSWQEGSARDSQEWDDERGPGDATWQEDQSLAKNTQQAGKHSAQMGASTQSTWARTTPPPPRGHATGHPALRRSARTLS